MKKLFKNVFITAALIAVFLFGVGGIHRQAPITPERVATHMITYLYQDEDSSRLKTGALCTGTAVGPHALLTAVHCDEGEFKVLRLDLDNREYHIIGYVTDDRDHIIYHLDGPAFTHYITIKERPTKLNEPVVSYGDGQGNFPQHTYIGKSIVDVNGGDTSEIDQADQIACFSIPAIPGDSGSAVYGKDGAIVALIEYEDEDTGHAVGFALNFDNDQLEKIKE